MATGSEPQGLAIVEQSAGVFELRGPLTFATAPAACEAGAQRFAASVATAFELDCRGVAEVDSAGLALLVEWLAWARASGRRMRISGVPQHLRELAAISDVDELLAEGV